MAYLKEPLLTLYRNHLMIIKQQRFQFEALTVNISDTTAIYRQLENQIRDAIWQGRLKAEERLPSTRILAKQLGIARNTVINAYEQLTVEGFLVTKHGSGTRVTADYPHQNNIDIKINNKSLTSIKKIILSERYRNLSFHELSIPSNDRNSAQPFRANMPEYDEFPSAQWTRLVTKQLRQKPSIWMEKSHPCGYWPLREAIASYLGVSRALSTKPEQIVVSAGAQQAIELLAKTLINPGDVVCFEDPGYTHAAMVFELAGAKIVTIPVDDDGLNVDVLRQSVETAKLVYVTPASHFPLGTTLSQARRQALLQWAEEKRAIIIEDDYNGEYRYRGRALPTLHAMANDDRVIYIGSFSKLLFPAFRLGYMVVPSNLVEPLGTVRWLLDRHSSTLDQMVLTDFINQGHFSRHVRKMKILYAQRQEAMIEAAKEYLAGIVEIQTLDGGLHLVGWLHAEVTQESVLRAASIADIELMAVSQFSFKNTDKRGIIFGYAAYSVDQIYHSMKALRDAYRQTSTMKPMNY